MTDSLIIWEYKNAPKLYVVPQGLWYQPQPFVHNPEDHRDMLCILEHVQQDDPEVHQQDEKDLLPHTSATFKRIVKNDNCRILV